MRQQIKHPFSLNLLYAAITVLVICVAVIVFYSTITSVDLGNTVAPSQQKLTYSAKTTNVTNLESSPTSIDMRQVLHELDAIGALLQTKDTNKVKSAMKRRGDIRLVLSNLGTNMHPYADDIIYRLHHGINPGDAAYALTQMGDSYTFAIVNALTNSLESVRLASASVVTMRHSAATTNAVAPLLALFSDESADVRLASVGAIGRIALFPDTCITPLLFVAQNDSEPVVRIVAAGAISRYGIHASQFTNDLHALIANETNAKVKQALSKVLRSIQDKAHK